ncbi:hypothetical protein [uncultured Psychroserpens sp.]|uniref:hypothetical protein n=1 Tax=uncultured Psychroserpens sp. TaxID=255436 RepID=UPI0026289F64|nr:hypothetical protein [uncultured Psychroserpens sp.]
MSRDSCNFMRPMNTAHHITHLLKKIQEFQVIKCNMHHERVVFNANRKPVYRKTANEYFFDRVNLCDAKLRKQRLGCAHSSVNQNFAKVIDDLAQQLPKKAQQILRFKKQCNNIVNKIYQLDHEKGQLEHDLALCKLTPDTHQENQLEVVSKLLKHRHGILMDELSVMKSDIELFIKSVLNNTH